MYAGTLLQLKYDYPFDTKALEQVSKKIPYCLKVPYFLRYRLYMKKM